MILTIDEHTLTEDVIFLLHSKNIEEVLEQVQPLPIATNIADMTIREFDVLLENPSNYIMTLMRENKRALDFLGKYKTFKQSMNGFFKFLQQYETKQSAEEKQAMSGVKMPSFSDRMLSTVIKYYGLHSIEEAADMKVKEFLFAFQDEGSSAMYQSRLNEIMQKKNKKK